MSLPTWATFVGIFMLLFGGCGVYQNIQKIYTPTALEEMSGEFEQIEMEMSKELGRDKNEMVPDSLSNQDTTSLEEDDVHHLSPEDSAGIAMFESVFGSLDNMLTFSDYYKKWIVRLGIIGTLASVLYGLGGLFLLMGKRFAIKVCIGAIIASMASVIFSIVIISADQESGFAAKATNFTSYFMIFINIMLFIVIMASDKTYFHDIEDDFS